MTLETPYQQPVRITPAMLGEYTVDRGGHDYRGSHLCTMELVSWVAGEPHSDDPECASKVLATMVRVWNDDIREEQRRGELMRPLIPALVNSRRSDDIEDERLWRLLKFYVKRQLTAWLDLAAETAWGRPSAAADLTSLRATLAAMSLEFYMDLRDVQQAVDGARVVAEQLRDRLIADMATDTVRVHVDRTAAWVDYAGGGGLAEATVLEDPEDWGGAMANIGASAHTAMCRAATAADVLQPGCGEPLSNTLANELAELTKELCEL